MNKGFGHESFRLLAEIRILDNMRNCTNNSEDTRGFLENVMKDKFAENIFIMISKAARNFVNPYSLEFISGHKTFEDLFTPHGEYKVPHIQLPGLWDTILRSAHIEQIMPDAGAE